VSLPQEAGRVASGAIEAMDLIGRPPRPNFLHCALQGAGGNAGGEGASRMPPPWLPRGCQVEGA
jgi:hypothetical protein